jgi:hypothetical protein
MAIAADGYPHPNADGKPKLAGAEACAMANVFTGCSSRALSHPSNSIRHDRPTSRRERDPESRYALKPDKTDVGRAAGE